jgi:hypothetical protein
MATKNPNISAGTYSAGSNHIQPSMGSRLYEDELGTILLGQPPEVLKGLLQHGISNIDTLSFLM